jgi:hypothetical protein
MRKIRKASDLDRNKFPVGEEASVAAGGIRPHVMISVTGVKSPVKGRVRNCVEERSIKRPNRMCRLLRKSSSKLPLVNNRPAAPKIERRLAIRGASRALEANLCAYGVQHIVEGVHMCPLEHPHLATITIHPLVPQDGGRRDGWSNYHDGRCKARVWRGVLAQLMGPLPRAFGRSSGPPSCRPLRPLKYCCPSETPMIPLRN